MQEKTKNLKVKLALGCISLVAGLWAANLALFQWMEPTGLYYLLGDYARYACAYGGFAAMILGAMLVNDFLVLRDLTTVKHMSRRSKVTKTSQRNLAKTERQEANNLGKPALTQKEYIEGDSLSEKGEERAAIAETT
jgi:hypothetical protein